MKKTIIVQRDVTPHDLEQHTGKPIEHTLEWYKYTFTNCPTCQAKPEFVEEPFTYEVVKLERKK